MLEYEHDRGVGFALVSRPLPLSIDKYPASKLENNMQICKLLLFVVKTRAPREFRVLHGIHCIFGLNQHPVMRRTYEGVGHIVGKLAAEGRICR